MTKDSSPMLIATRYREQAPPGNEYGCERTEQLLHQWLPRLVPSLTRGVEREHKLCSDIPWSTLCLEGSTWWTLHCVCMSIIRTTNPEAKLSMKMKLWGETFIATFQTLVWPPMLMFHLSLDEACCSVHFPRLQLYHICYLFLASLENKPTQYPASKPLIWVVIIFFLGIPAWAISWLCFYLDCGRFLKILFKQIHALHSRRKGRQLWFVTARQHS